MELKDFIKKTVLQLAQSVDELNNEMPGKLIVNPATVSGAGKNPHVEIQGYMHNVMEINFDLTLIAENTAGSQGKIWVMAAVLNAGGSCEEGKTNKSENKIRFTLPVVLPAVEVSAY